MLAHQWRGLGELYAIYHQVDSLGSRPGAILAGAWAVMNHMGEEYVLLSICECWVVWQYPAEQKLPAATSILAVPS